MDDARWPLAWHCRPLAALAGLMVGCTVPGAPAVAAARATFTATADGPLRFGTIVTVSGGTRTVGADGSTSSSGVFALGDRTARPAQFTMTFTRASGDHATYQLIFQFSLPAPGSATANGVRGRLVHFTTDLPHVPEINPGQTVVYTLTNCVTATCSVTFHVGGTLTVAPGHGGGTLTFPLILQTTVTAVLG